MEEVQGENLGKKHQHFNSKVNTIVKDKTPFNTVIAQYGDSDIDHLMKIEIASKYRHVEYILEVFKSEDMLYVSRAIKKSTWLITDDQYAHIINPQYLYSELFPYMTSKAICKLLLHIRLHLKNEARVDEFYKYYEQQDVDKALKWLQNCSLAVINKAVEQHSRKIKNELFKRLCERSFTVFENVDKNYQCDIRRHHGYFQIVKFFLNTHTEQYLDAVEKSPHHLWPKFGKRHTAMIMKRCPERILNKFEKYATQVDIHTVGCHLGPKNIKEFILRLGQNRNLEHWFKYKNLKPLIKLMPKEGKFEFLKTIFINKGHVTNTRAQGSFGQVRVVECSFMSSAAKSYSNPASSENVYQWYRHAPFETALPDLIKLVKTESSPEERGAILRVMLTTAGRNMDHIQTVLQYYHDKHINEAFKYKVNFVNAVISVTDTHKYNEKTWQILDELFHNMEVYTESNNYVQNCIEAIIVYKILHQQPIPEIVEKKFNYTTFKKLKAKLTAEDKEALFMFLYTRVETKLRKLSLSNQEEFNEVVSLLYQIFNLFIDWDKELVDYPFILDKIKEVIKLKKEKDLNVSLEAFYNKKKSWRKSMFEESLLLVHSENVCINALKHNPELLQRYDADVDAICRSDNIDLRRVLSKLRIYWSQSLAEQWATAYRNRITEQEGHRSLTRGLCAILPHNELLELLDKYAPDTNKIAWSETDKIMLSLQKHFARLMHSTRPQPPPATVMKYARGDYLQYTLPSLISIFLNMPSNKSRDHIPQLLNSGVSIKKHGIRLAFAKLKSDELEVIFSNIWVSTKNLSIRAVIFKQTFQLLCREKNPYRIEELWKLLESFINKLSSEENKNIYVLLTQVDKVPRIVQGAFCMKSYKLLKSLPPKANCENFVEKVSLYTANIMELIDPDFIADILLDFIDIWFVKKKILKDRFHGHPINILTVFSAYLIIVHDKNEQKKRFDTIFKPLLKYILEMWKEEFEEQNVVEKYFEFCINSLVSCLKYNLVRKKCVLPETVFMEIANELDSKLPIVENYHIITFCKLIVAYLQCCDIVKNELETIEETEDTSDDIVPFDIVPFRGHYRNNNKENKVWAVIRPVFAKHCMKLLKEDIDKYFPSIQIMFKGALKQFHSTVVTRAGDDVIDFAKALMEADDSVPTYLTAIDFIVPVQCFNVTMKEKHKVIREYISSHPSLEIKMHYFKKHIY